MAIVFTEAWDAAGGSPVVLASLEPQAGGIPIMVLDSRPFRGTGEVASSLAAIVAAARKRIWITNAYFAPRRRAVSALGDAARRGVDVRLLLPGRTDVPIVRHAGHGYFAALLRRSVRVFEYQPAVLHSKTLVADDFLVFAGSSNLDFRSFHFNAECNVVMLDADTGKAERAPARAVFVFIGAEPSADPMEALQWDMIQIRAPQSHELQSGARSVDVGILACDLLHLDTITLHRLYVFFVIVELSRMHANRAGRRIRIEIGTSPTTRQPIFR